MFTTSKSSFKVGYSFLGHPVYHYRFRLNCFLFFYNSRLGNSKFDKDQIRSIDLFWSDLKIEADRYQTSGKIRSLLWFFIGIYRSHWSFSEPKIMELWSLSGDRGGNRRWPRMCSWGRSLSLHSMCMIKIFRGGRGGDTFKTPSPYEQLLPLPTPCFKMFLERSVNDPHPTSSIFHCYPPHPIHHPFPPLKILIIHHAALPLVIKCVWGIFVFQKNWKGTRTSVLFLWIHNCSAENS